MSARGPQSHRSPRTDPAGGRGPGVGSSRLCPRLSPRARRGADPDQGPAAPGDGRAPGSAAASRGSALTCRLLQSTRAALPLPPARTAAAGRGFPGRLGAPVTGGPAERCGLWRCPVTALTQRNPGGQRCPAPFPHRPR